MSQATRPRRSVLYMPGANARALDKARTLPADALILDLEDAVAPAAKEQARRQVVAALAAGGYGRRELAVRLNGFDTPWGADDVAAIARSGCDAVVLPKVESVGMLADLRHRLTAAGAPAVLPLWAMIETPRGVLKVAEIAQSPGLACLVMGTSDLTNDLRARHTAGRLPLLTALGLCLLAARAHGLAILDGVHLDIQDAQGFAEACRQGAELGFDGKTLIHPAQIEAANAAFGPSADAVAEARRILAAFAVAEAEGKGVALLDGRLIENLHVAEARRTLALAQAMDALGS